jgi:hypothetical protein
MRYVNLAALIAFIALLVLTFFAFSDPANAHGWYSEKTDPVTHRGCCGGTECGMWAVQPGAITAEETGYRVRLTTEQARLVRKDTTAPIDALVIYARVQPSEDGNWHLCITKERRDLGFDSAPEGVYCLFEPPHA